MPYITTDDHQRLYYEEAGSGPTLLFVHEFAGDHRSWEPQMRYFSRRFRCVAYSARGYLPSSVPESVDDYSQWRVSEDIRCMIEGLQVQRAHVVGLSMGAFATLHFGMRYAHDPISSGALSLTLAGCGTGSPPEVHEAFKKDSVALGEALCRDGMAQAGEAYCHGPTRLPFLRKNPRGHAEFLRQFCEHSATGSGLTSMGYQGRRPSLYALKDEIARIAAPTLILVGDSDEPCLDTSLMLKRTIVGSHMAVLPNSGHGINLEEPALFNRLLGDFLTGL
ncbi:MAG: alpha/beta hydrolase [Alphaproteobacteria bacterium]|nr:alpha/beta hydrolase [Alphaproteobacteria bacterium]